MRQGGHGWLVGIAAATVAGGMLASSLLSARGDGVEARIKAFVAAHPSVRPAAIANRTSLWGETWDEDAGLGYAAAATMLSRRIAHQPLFQQLGQASSANLRAVNWPALAPVAAVLRRAAHAGRFELGAPPSPELMAVLSIARLRAVDEGDFDACVECWLDEAVLWCDRSDFWAFAAAWPPELVARLGAGAAARLAVGLERLEQRRPPHFDVAARLARFADNWLRPDSARNLPVGVWWRSWRHGFDPRQRELAAIAGFLEAAACIAGSSASWPARDAQWQRFLDRDAGSPRSTTSIWLQHHRSLERSQYEQQAYSRLLRLALAFQLGQPLPELVDPLTGGPFLVQVHGDVATFRSAAPNASLSRWAKRR